jgi:signal transduction histidine kinase
MTLKLAALGGDRAFFDPHIDNERRFASSFEALLEVLNEEPIDAVLVDHQTLSVPASRVVEMVAGTNPMLLIVILTRDPSLDGAELLIKGRVWVLPRETAPAKLRAALDSVAERSASMLGAVADYRAALDRLQAQRAWSESVSRELDQLIHELKTPVAVVQGFSSNLIEGYEGPLSPQQKARIERIKVATDLMSELLAGVKRAIPPAPVSSAQDPPSTSSSDLVLRRRPIDVRALGDEAVSLLEGAAKAAGVELKSRTEPDLPRVWGERPRLLQLLVNLISNALRFTPADGRIEVMARLEGPKGVPAESCDCRIMVRDSGRGIAPEILEEIWRPGFSSQGRTGLGLHIARQIADEHGGTLSVESVPGKTTFSLLIPVDVRSRHASPNVMIIDDPTLAGQLLIELRTRHRGRLPARRPTDMEKVASAIMASSGTVVFAGNVEESLGRETLDLPLMMQGE